MSLRKPPARSEKFLAACRSNGNKSQGPTTEAGNRRSSMNRFKHGLYSKPDSATRELMENLGEDPDLVMRVERELRQSLQPANAMEAMIVADIAKLYGEKALLESTVRLVRDRQGEYVNWQAYDDQHFRERVIPGNRMWSVVQKQQGRLDWRIEAKLNMLLRLKKQLPVAGAEGTEEPSALSCQPPAEGAEQGSAESEPDSAKPDALSPNPADRVAETAPGNSVEPAPAEG